MNAKDLLLKIKALFEEVPAPAPIVEPAPVEFKEYTLLDGSMVMIDKLEVGGAVTKDGFPAPAGEYTLADNSAIVLDEAGLILELKAAEPAEVEVEVEQVAAPAPTPIALKDERVDNLIAENKAIKEGFKQLVSLVESLIEAPAVEPLEVQKNAFGEVRKDKSEKFKNIQEALKRVKK